MTMMRAGKILTNLGVVYIEGNILVWQYDSVRGYWFSEHWSEIPLGIWNQKVPSQIKFSFLKNLILLD